MDRFGVETYTRSDGYPIIDATHVALSTTRQFLEQNTSVCLRHISGKLCRSSPVPQVSRVIFVVFSKKDEQVYRGVVAEYFPAS